MLNRSAPHPPRFQGGIRVNHLGHLGLHLFESDWWNDEFHPIESVPNQRVAIILLDGKDFALLEIKHPRIDCCTYQRPLALPS